MLMLRDFPVQLNSVRSVLLTVALCVAPGALAAPFSMSDGVAVTGADGNQVKMFGFATFWNSLCACVPLKDLGFDTRLLAQLSYWRGYDESTDHRSLWEASVTPTLRWTASLLPIIPRKFANMQLSGWEWRAERTDTQR